jgi:hypothetical protein
MIEGMKAKCLATILVLGVSVTGAMAQVASGLAPGTPTPSVPVFDVTGAYAGKRICYVCDFQDHPNVIAFFRDADEQTAELIVQLDQLYRQEKKRNFKAVAIVVVGLEARSWLEELRKSRNIEIPLTVLYKGQKDVGIRLYKLDPKARNTFLITRNRTVETNVSDIGPTAFDKVKQATMTVLAKPGKAGL